VREQGAEKNMWTKIDEVTRGKVCIIRDFTGLYSNINKI
jgi:hypothetical protein